jgi:outer membrane protein X
MKKYLFILVAMFAMSTAAFAQKGVSAVGIQGAFDDLNSQFGIGAKYQYGFLDQLRGEIGGDFFFKKNYTSLVDINGNVHFVFPIASSFNVYPLAGLNIGFASLDDDVAKTLGVKSSETRLGVNVGGGFDIKVTDGIKIILEAKYIISDNGWSRFGANAGVAFMF